MCAIVSSDDWLAYSRRKSQMGKQRQNADLVWQQDFSLFESVGFSPTWNSPTRLCCHFFGAFYQYSNAYLMSRKLLGPHKKVNLVWCVKNSHACSHDTPQSVKMKSLSRIWNSKWCYPLCICTSDADDQHQHHISLPSSVDAFVAYLNRIHEWKIDSILIGSDFLHTYSFLFMSRDSKTHNQSDDAVCKSNACERKRSISEFIGFSWMFDDAKRAREKKTRKISERSPTSGASMVYAGGTGITGDVFPSETTQTNKCTSITLHTLDVGSCLDVHSLQFPRKDICSSSWWQSSSFRCGKHFQ